MPSSRKSTVLPITESARRAQERQFEHTIEVVALDLLENDRTFQRPVNERWVKRLAANWNPRAAGLLKVSRRADGRWIILDGQHRVLAMMERGVTHWEAQVFHGLRHEEEALIWNEGNDMLLPHALHKFKARVEARDEVAYEVHRIVVAAGGKISSGAGTSGIQAVKTLEQVHSWGVLQQVMRLWSTTWGWGGYPSRDMILGLGGFSKLYLDNDSAVVMDEKRIVERFARLSPVKLEADSKALASLHSEKRSWVHIAYRLREEANHGKLQHLRLPEVTITLGTPRLWGSGTSRGLSGASRSYKP